MISATAIALGVITLAEPAAASSVPSPRVDPATERRQSEALRTSVDLRARRIGFFAGAGAALAAGAVLNLMRIRVVSGACQTRYQLGCTSTWFPLTVAAWGSNIAGIGLAAAGGDAHGRLTARRPYAEVRARRWRIIGAATVALGVAGNVALRAAWTYDYFTPGGADLFDFSERRSATQYYAGLQLSAFVVALGIAASSYGHSRDPAVGLTVTPQIDRSFAGVRIRGRF